MRFVVPHNITIAPKECHGISSHWQLDCFLNSLFRLRIEKNIKALHYCLFMMESHWWQPVTPNKRPVMLKVLDSRDVIIVWIWRAKYSVKQAQTLFASGRKIVSLSSLSSSSSVNFTLSCTIKNLPKLWLLLSSSSRPGHLECLQWYGMAHGMVADRVMWNSHGTTCEGRNSWSFTGGPRFVCFFWTNLSQSYLVMTWFLVKEDCHQEGDWWFKIHGSLFSFRADPCGNQILNFCRHCKFLVTSTTGAFATKRAQSVWHWSKIR